MTFTCKSSTRFLFLVLLLLSTAPSCPAKGQRVEQGRGADPEVDYQSLTRFGPWDDRNYALSASDLECLAPNEDELRDPVPAFFRVLLRKRLPQLPPTGPYPRSVLQIFRQEFGGYLIDGRVYDQLEVKSDGRYVVIQENGRQYDGLEGLESVRTKLREGPDCTQP